MNGQQVGQARLVIVEWSADTPSATRSRTPLSDV